MVDAATDVLLPPLLFRSFTGRRRSSRAAGHVKWRHLRPSTSFGGSVKLREHYLRTDVTCGSAACTVCPPPPAGSQAVLLSPTASHYLLPDADVVVFFLDLFEALSPVAADVILLQTVVRQVYDHPVQKRWKRMRKFLQDTSRRTTLFSNDHHPRTHTARRRAPGGFESVADQRRRAVVAAATWLHEHLQHTGIPLVVVSPSTELAETLRGHGVVVMSCSAYVESSFCRGADVGSGALAQAAAMCDSLTAVYDAKMAAYAAAVEAAATAGAVGGAAVAARLSRTAGDALHADHVPAEQLADLWRRGSVIRGRLDIRKYAPTEGAVKVSASMRQATDSGLPTGATEVLIVGATDMNRAMHGDDVAVELLPRSEWRASVASRQLVSPTIPGGDDDDDDGDDAGGVAVGAAGGEPVPSGRVVGVFARHWREYVATLPAVSTGVGADGEDATAASDEAVLVVPMDPRVPKIRIRTRQAAVLAGHRLVVAVDGWDTTSKYPGGHYLRTLGPVLDMEAEMQALLVETETHSHLRPFPDAALRCLPSLPPGFPWRVEASGGVGTRRDLRHTHPVCSIDPPGCQDIDDALSVCKLPNGNIEVGVHIADVTQFVAHNSALDLEARRRGTTVYLVDRRLDMLPSLLSENLCSLRARVDRFAVSVLWEFTPGLRLIPDKTWMGRTVIRSSHALTYYQAQRLIDGKHADESPVSTPPPDDVDGGVCGAPVPVGDEPDLRPRLRLLTDVARRLRKTRERDGALALESAELKFVLGSNRQPEAIKTKHDMEVHHTIAEMMIFANSTVAKFIVDTFPLQALLRRHSSPELTRFQELAALAAAAGLSLDTTSNAALAKSLAAADSTMTVPAATSLLKSMATRAMSEAEYVCTGDVSSAAGAPFAHYGLAVEYYTHFTSPIRRYADVVVHRLLLAALGRTAAAVTSPRAAPPTAPRAGVHRPLPASSAPSVLEPATSGGWGVPAAAPADGAGAGRGSGSGSGSSWGVPAATSSSATGWGTPSTGGGWGEPRQAKDAPVPDSAPAPADATSTDAACAWGAPSGSSPDATGTTGTTGTTDRDADPSPRDGGGGGGGDDAADGKPPFIGSELSVVCTHINGRNRSAKLAGMESDQLFLSLYFKDHPQVVDAVIVSARRNGVLAFVPKYGIKCPVFFASSMGVPMLPPALFGLPPQPRAGDDRLPMASAASVDTAAGRLQQALDAVGALPQRMYGAALELCGDGAAAELRVHPPPFAAADTAAVVFAPLQSVRTLLFCDFSETSTRRPPLRMALLPTNDDTSRIGQVEAAPVGVSATTPPRPGQRAPPPEEAAVEAAAEPTGPVWCALQVAQASSSAAQQRKAATTAAAAVRVAVLPTVAGGAAATDVELEEVEAAAATPGAPAPRGTTPSAPSDATTVMHRGRLRFNGFEPAPLDLATARRRAAARRDAAGGGGGGGSLLDDAELLAMLDAAGDNGASYASGGGTATRLASDRAALKQAEVAATRRMNKLKAGHRHAKIDKSRRRK